VFRCVVFRLRGSGSRRLVLVYLSGERAGSFVKDGSFAISLHDHV
jgi:hypothetical protein